MKKLIFGIILTAVALGVFAAVNHMSPEAPQTTADETAGYKVGDIATDFKLKNVDGSMVSLAGIEDAKGYIVTFTSNVCPFAVMYEDRLIALHEEFAPKGYPVVAINSNDPALQEGDSFENMQKRAVEKGFPFAYLVDEGQKIYPQYGATKTPHIFLLDKDLRVQYIGTIDDNAQSPEAVKTRYVADAINALENGKLPDPNFTKSVGCPIKSAKSGAGDRRQGPPNGERRQAPSTAQLLEMMDQDGDQKISKAEAKGPLQNDFARLDVNGDGQLTKEELSKTGPSKR